MKLAGKSALVTGAAQGIGAAIALRLAQEGADIIIDDRIESESAKATEKAITDLGRKVVFVAEDLSEEKKDIEMIQVAVQKMGKIDILVNNAGVERNASFWDVTEKDFDFVLDVNLKGLFFATQEFVKHRMAVKQPGKIINISSVHEELPFPHFSSYCATKGALKMLTRNLSIELAPYNITINNIALAPSRHRSTANCSIAPICSKRFWVIFRSTVSVNLGMSRALPHSSPPRTRII